MIDLTTRDRVTAGVYGAGALVSLVVTTSDGWAPGIGLSASACAIALALWVTA